MKKKKKSQKRLLLFEILFDLWLMFYTFESIWYFWIRKLITGMWKL